MYNLQYSHGEITKGPLRLLICYLLVYFFNFYVTIIKSSLKAFKRILFICTSLHNIHIINRSKSSNKHTLHSCWIYLANFCICRYVGHSTLYRKYHAPAEYNIKISYYQINVSFAHFIFMTNLWPSAEGRLPLWVSSFRYVYIHIKISFFLWIYIWNYFRIFVSRACNGNFRILWIKFCPTTDK